MTNEQILQKALERAVENGWNRLKDGMYPNISIDNLAVDIASHGWQYRKLVFDHDFAKAFWAPKHKNSKKTFRCDCSDYNCCTAELPIWQHHLQQMVLEEDPLLYLKKFL